MNRFIKTFVDNSVKDVADQANKFAECIEELDNIALKFCGKKGGAE